MSWIILCVAGLLEVAWASVLPTTDGFSRPLATVGFLALLAASMYGLAKATETIPIGTGYAVWVGIGAVGTALVGMARGDAVTAARLVSLGLVLAGVTGLNVWSSH